MVEVHTSVHTLQYAHLIQVSKPFDVCGSVCEAEKNEIRFVWNL